jgi:25S rRNA (uracil2634-N3)-methyltransferase
MGRAGNRISKGKLRDKHVTSKDQSQRRRQHSQALPKTNILKQKRKPAKTVQASQRPKIPFGRKDRVLLIGEGDFSFTLSLVQNYRLKSVTATCYDDEKSLLEKYPNVKATISALESGSESPVFDGFSPPATPTGTSEPARQTSTNVIFGVDATKLHTAHRKQLRQYEPFTKIVFNFPHTGGLSTDVNRQVRANQELLVKFFESATPFLTSAAENRDASHTMNNNERYDTDDEEEDSDAEASQTSRPQILVSLFESAPYALWNIRDLARHCGLQVVESFKFPWEAYPGYTHARTVGDIVTGKDRSEEGKRKGKWRGEERAARCYVFELKADSNTDGQSKASSNGGVQRKRKRGHDEEDDEIDA